MSLSDRIAVMSGGRICQIDTPERLYRKPADRFVASFIGEGSLLKATLDQIDGDSAIVSVGGANVTVPAKPLSGISAGAQRRPVRAARASACAAAGEAALQGVVAASIYQGDHVDLYIDVPEAASGRIHMRLSAREAAGISGSGSKIAHRPRQRGCGGVSARPGALMRALRSSARCRARARAIHKPRAAVHRDVQIRRNSAIGSSCQSTRRSTTGQS